MLYVLYNIHLCYIGPICGIALLIRKLQSFKDKKVRSMNFTENMFKRGLKLTNVLENLAQFSVSEVILKQHSNQNKGKGRKLKFCLKNDKIDVNWIQQNLMHSSPQLARIKNEP